MAKEIFLKIGDHRRAPRHEAKRGDRRALLVEPSADDFPIPTEAEERQKNGKLAIMNRLQVRKVVGVLLLAVGWQLFSGWQLYAQRANFAVISAAEAEAGREALTDALADVPGRVNSFITFDVPGAINGTHPSSFNPAGAITGYYNDTNFLGHGFLRNNDGAFITFDVPGAVKGTYPAGINPAGAITGYYNDANSLGHGFLRASDGTFTTFDAPNGVIGTFPSSINPGGAITGSYYDLNFVGHGFLRSPSGTFTTFDAPNAGTTGSFPGTYAVGINPAGAIAGMYTDANNGSHGFLRASDGTITEFDPPGRIAIFVRPSFTIVNYLHSIVMGDGSFAEHLIDPITGFSFGDASFPGLKSSLGLYLSVDATGTIVAGKTTFSTVDISLMADIGHNDGTPSATLGTANAPGTVAFSNSAGVADDITLGSGSLISASMYRDSAGTRHATYLDNFIFSPGVSGFFVLPFMHLQIEELLTTLPSAFTQSAPDRTTGRFEIAVNGGSGEARFGVPEPPSVTLLGQNLSLNPNGVITGTYFEPILGNPFGGNYRVFVRTPDGIFTTFDAVTYPHGSIWSFPSGITPGEVITGSFSDGFAVKHGFLRDSDGRVTSFDVPGAGTGFDQGTVPLGISPAGLIMGLYIDAKSRPHGFFFLPRR
jgi:hypothetical protein